MNLLQIERLIEGIKPASVTHYKHANRPEDSPAWSPPAEDKETQPSYDTYNTGLSQN